MWQNLRVTGLIESAANITIAITLSSTILAIPAVFGQNAETVAVPKEVDDQYCLVEKLIKGSYPEAKFTRSTQALHVQYKIKREIGYYSERAAMIPDDGGIICDITYEPGPSNEPQSVVNDGYYSTQTISSYSSSLKGHLFARLLIPSYGCSSDFTEGFADLMARFSSPDSGSKLSTIDENQTVPVASSDRITPSRASSQAPEQSAQSVALAAQLRSDGVISSTQNIQSFHQRRFDSKYDQGVQQPLPSNVLDNFPAELPQVILSHSPIKLNVTQSVNANSSQFDQITRGSEREVFQAARKAIGGGQLVLAQKLYEHLCAKYPKDPRYFYGAGCAYRKAGDAASAFANFAIAWHVSSGDPRYQSAAEVATQQVQAQYDQYFKLTYGYAADDPSVLLNAGVRCWKLGLTKQSVQLFEYTLHNNPAFARVAAYNLGAAAEHNGQFRLAARYYGWALRNTITLEREQDSDVNSSFGLLARSTIEDAQADVQRKIQVQDWRWNGWIQSQHYPAPGQSEVCPICAIVR